MSGNTSATGGYLQPVTSAPANDEALENILQSMVVGITGLPGRLVRPRWQPIPPTAPEFDENWCAIGVMDQQSDMDPVQMNGADGVNRFRRNDEFSVLASFYGPDAGGFAQKLNDGLAIAQNREAIHQAGLVFVDSGAARPGPELLAQRWRRRWDLPLTFRRVVLRTYPILNFETSSLDLLPPET